MGEALLRLCTICARSGSRGVPGKNLRILHARPLIAHSIMQAKRSGLFRTIAASSDSERILKVARECGADLLIRRPHRLSTDQASKYPVIQHALRRSERSLGVKFETIVDLDVTAPLRMVQDIRNAVRLLEKKGVSNVITGSRARHSPYFNLVELNAGGFVRLSKPGAKSVFRRQDAPLCFDMNASIYVWRRDALLNNKFIFNADTLLYEMPEDRSKDIDSELDFRIVDFLMRDGVKS